MRSHTGERPYACDFCAHRASVKGHLTTHMRTHTGKGPTHATSARIVRVVRVVSQHISDPTLGKGPTHATSARIVRVVRVVSQHICDPHWGKAYACDFCDYRASEKGNLTTHMRTHTGKGPTHATSVIIVRVGRVISQHISDEGTMEAGDM